MATWIAPNKLTPPPLPPGWLARTLLPDDAAAPPVTLLVAGPGDGKTLALLSLAEQARARGAIIVWYGLDEFDADVASFFHGLVAAVRAHVPPFGEEVLAQIESGRAEPKRLWQAFFGALAAFNLPDVVIALDDAHWLFELEARPIAALTPWFDKLPPGLRLAIATRRRWPEPTSRLQQRGHVQWLGGDRLRFTPEEQAAFLRLRDPEGRRADAWNARAAALDGWPLGLDLLLLGADAPLPAAGDALGEAFQSRLEAYVAEELYGVQPSAVRAFMLEAGLLETITPEACEAVLGLAEAPAHLAALEQDHLLRRTGAADYRFAPYLRDFLRAEAARVRPAGALEAQHRRAAAYFHEQARHEEALVHLLACGEWRAALAECARVFPTMRHTGRHATIRAWLERFPAAIAEREPSWQLWHAHVLSRAGRQQEAQTAYERACAGFEAHGDRAGAFKAQTSLCNLALLQDDRKRFGQLLLRAQALQADAHDEDLADLQLIRALAAEQRGDMALMQECNAAVLAIPVGDSLELAASHCIAMMNLHTHALHRGELADASALAERLVGVAATHGFRPFELYARFLLAHVQVIEGRIEEAAAFFRALPPDWAARLDWHDEACAWYILGHFHVARGDGPEAEEALKRSRQGFARAGFQEGLKLPLAPTLWLAIARGQHSRVEALLEAWGTIAPTNVYDAGLLLARARAHHLGGRSDAAAAILDALVPELERLEAGLLLVNAWLYRAAVRLRLGNAAGAAADRAQAEAAIAARGYAFLHGQDRALWQELGATSPVARVESRAALEIACFGALTVRVDGVSLDRWPRRQSKLLLAALALSPRGLTAEELAAAVGADEGARGDFASIKVSLTVLRRTLDPTADAKAGSRHVLREGDRYRLPADVRCDVREFLAAAAEGERLRAASPLEAAAHDERALALYHGNLLEDGYFAAHFAPEREAYKQQALGMLAWLGEFYSGLGDFTRAEAALQRAVELSPCDEAATIALMRFLAARGRADKARQAYWDCRRALKRQLDAPPGTALEALHRTLTR